jgi:transcriptional regulator with XRE-family HTH domain
MANWKILGKRLKRERVRAGFSFEQLAARAGISERSIRRYEARDTSTRKEQVVALAKALGIAAEELGKPSEAPAVLSATRTNRELLDRHFPKRSELERRVALEADSYAVRGLPLPENELTAKRLQDIFTVYVGYAGRRFLLTGLVDRQRGLSVQEGESIGSKSGVGARFHVVKLVAPNEPIGVTVYTRAIEDSLAFQDRFNGEVSVEVSVVVREIENGFPGFSFFGGESKRPWMFVVERIVR